MSDCKSLSKCLCLHAGVAAICYSTLSLCCCPCNKRLGESRQHVLTSLPLHNFTMRHTQPHSSRATFAQAFCIYYIHTLCLSAHARPQSYKLSIMLSVQVSVYGRSRLSQDVFLGEVLIPLREVEEAGATGVAEVHKYILGRRSTKERVSGEIALACSWRVTPLDVVIMKVSLFTLPCSTAVGTHTPHLILSCAWVKVQ